MVDESGFTGHRSLLHEKRNVLKSNKVGGFAYNVFEHCEFVKLTDEIASLPFFCGDDDLKDFFIMKQYYMQRLV